MENVRLCLPESRRSSWNDKKDKYKYLPSTTLNKFFFRWFVGSQWQVCYGGLSSSSDCCWRRWIIGAGLEWGWTGRTCWLRQRFYFLLLLGAVTVCSPSSAVSPQLCFDSREVKSWLSLTSTVWQWPVNWNIFTKPERFCIVEILPVFGNHSHN